MAVPVWDPPSLMLPPRKTPAAPRAASPKMMRDWSMATRAPTDWPRPLYPAQAMWVWICTGDTEGSVASWGVRVTLQAESWAAAVEGGEDVRTSARPPEWDPHPTVHLRLAKRSLKLTCKPKRASTGSSAKAEPTLPFPPARSNEPRASPGGSSAGRKAASASVRHSWSKGKGSGAVVAAAAQRAGAWHALLRSTAASDTSKGTASRSGVESPPLLRAASSRPLPMCRQRRART
mmetsp:Transcript_12673/g.38171  ORF Transcript_12673/g.38171 Transcript_12673/m.38171 type:complete len:234 (+) Transcript_12673:765-1466(+)